MKCLRVGCNYNFRIIERASAGVRVMTINGKLDKIDDFYIWVNGENFRKDYIVNWE